MPSEDEARVPEKDAQEEMHTAGRVCADEQPGPSRPQAPRQGYCGYCRVIYSSLEEHLSSSRHRGLVRASSRGSSAASSSVSSSRTSSLMERFLQDVIKHHPHRYVDTRPSHADLPSLSCPPVPKEELADLFVSGDDDDDSRSLGTREDLPSSDEASVQPPPREEPDAAAAVATDTRDQSGKRLGGEEGQERPSPPIPDQETRQPPAPAVRPHSPHPKHPPSVHRKAHRKTDRRRGRDSSSSSSSSSSAPSPIACRPPPRLSPPPSRELAPCPAPRAARLAWATWERERRGAHREEAFSSDGSDPVGETIEEVIQRCCHGRAPASRQQGETESFHFSLPSSLGTGESGNWDTPVQATLEQSGTHADPRLSHARPPPDLARLTGGRVALEDRVYAHRLEAALHAAGAGRRRRPAEGYGAPPIEEVLPAPAYIPECFRGKTWAQIEREDDEKVENLVREFRRGKFFCVFDSESLARYGRRGCKKKGRGQKEKVDIEADMLPLLDHGDDDNDPAFIGRRRRTRRAFRLASRCQVVKVSHGTQTIQFIAPTVRQPHLPANAPPANQEPAGGLGEEKTPEARGGLGLLRLPASYSRIVTPLHPRTSVVYLLCTPEEPAPSSSDHALLLASRAHMRCRKRKRPLERHLEGLKVKYKRAPFRFYDPVNNRILKSAPRGRRPRAGSPRPPVVRQLFRSLSPDLNAEGVGPAGGTGRGGGRGSRRRGSARSPAATPPFGRPVPDGDRLLLGSLPADESGKGGGGVRRRGGGGTPPTDVRPSPLRRSSRSARGPVGRGEEAQASPSPSKRGTRDHCSAPKPGKGAPRRAADRRKVPESRGPLEVSSIAHRTTRHGGPHAAHRSLRPRRGRDCPCCKS